MKISGLNKLTLLDYPKHTACTVFTAGCNFRCPFCHNASLVLAPSTQPEISQEEFFAFLKKRTKILEGVAITGGEPTLMPDLANFISKIKDLGFDVKLDTNGMRPDVVSSLIDRDLVDYFAMDVKNSPERYGETVGLNEIDLAPIRESINIIITRARDYEFRTTVSPELHSLSDVQKIGEMIKGARRAFLQAYKDSGDVIDARFSTPSADIMQEYKSVLSQFVGEVGIRGL